MIFPQILAFPTKKQTIFSPFCLFPARQKTEKPQAFARILPAGEKNGGCSPRKQVQPESLGFRLPYSLTSRNQLKACFHAFFFSVF
ncbi:MAG TPA: hypothetical protein K8U98_10595, partial [Anaerotignum lactatifermentans]|nr:hypothetical protein [Anaerotignum lactatifermentans]